MRPIYDHPLPAEWAEVPLREVVTLKRGHSWSKEQEALTREPGTIPVIRIPNIQSRLDLHDLLFLRGVTEDQLKESAVSSGWILVVASNGNPNRIGDSVHIDVDLEMVFASFLVALTPKDRSKIDSRFLAYWLKLHNIHETISKTSQKTSGLANLSWSAIKTLPVRFPSDIKEQERIVELLESVDTLIELTSRQTRFLREAHGGSSDMELRGDDAEDDAPSALVSVSSELDAALQLKFAMLEELLGAARRIRELQ